jgi:hypothetical protein
VNLTVDYKQKMYADGSYYDGALNAKGERHGFGLMRWKNGDWIEGDYKHDELKEGRGGRTVGEEVKEGIWTHDVLIGRFEGHWSPDEPYSNGIVRSLFDGEVYEGERKFHKLHGRGRRVLASGIKWVGEWKDGKFQRGRYTEHDGSCYEGAFERGLLQGEGKYVSVSDGYTDEGFFTDANIMQGTRTWNDGDVYEGSFITEDDYEDRYQTCTAYHGFGVLKYTHDGLPCRYEGMSWTRLCFRGWRGACVAVCAAGGGGKEGRE